MVSHISALIGFQIAPYQHINISSAILSIGRLVTITVIGLDESSSLRTANLRYGAWQRKQQRTNVYLKLNPRLPHPKRSPIDLLPQLPIHRLGLRSPGGRTCLPLGLKHRSRSYVRNPRIRTKNQLGQVEELEARVKA
jgi:hypothetical protein